MQKVLKNEIDARYKQILRNLSSNWKIELKNKYEELIGKGLHTSGRGIQTLYNLIEKSIYNSINKLDRTINQISKEFKTVIPHRELKKYIHDFEKAIYGHIATMQEDVKNTVHSMTPSCEDSFESQINNIKGNAKNKLDRIYAKNKNLQKFKNIEWLVMLNTIIAFAGLVVGIISLFKDSTQVQYLTIFF